MSSYIYFYTREGDNFHPMGTFCRGSAIYQAGKDYGAPYEKIRPLKAKRLKYILEGLEIDINDCKLNINKIYKEIDFIKECVSSLEEKTEKYRECMQLIDEYNESISEYIFAKKYYDMLLLILDSVQYDERYDENSYIYFGIEIPENITKEDIIE